MAGAPAAERSQEGGRGNGAATAEPVGKLSLGERSAQNGVLLSIRAYVSRARLWKLGGWFVLGVGALVVELGLITLLHEPLALPLWLATAVAAETTILGRFFANDRFVFGHLRPTRRRLLRYHGACAGSFVVSWLVINGLASGFGVQYQVAAIIGSGASFFWSLLTNFLWVWRPARLKRTFAAGGSTIEPSMGSARQ